MPRSFLVKKQQSSRRVCRGRQSPQTDEPSSSEHEDVLQQSRDPHKHQEVGASWQPPHTAPQLSSALCPTPVLQRCCPGSSTFSLSDSHSDVGPRSPPEALGPSQACTTLILELQCEAEEPQQAKDRLPPPPLARLALVPGIPAGGLGSQESSDCLDCRQRFFSEISRREHLRCEWSSEKFFSCRYCDKEYVSLGALKMHIRTHTLPYVCKLCGKAFSRPWLLQGHIRTHTGEKPFTCLHCGRAFADRSNLRAHLQTHADVKKYQCGRCCKTFSRISLLAKHQEAGCPLS